MSKRELRQELRRKLAAIPAEELQQRSAAACRRLSESEEYRRAEVVMLFLSTPGEVDTSQLALQAWADAKRVLAPRVTWDQRRMLPIEIQSLGSGVEDGYMGIREPIEGLPVPVADIDLVIVPGLAFDEQGNRLGRGRGVLRSVFWRIPIFAARRVRWRWRTRWSARFRWGRRMCGWTCWSPT